MCKKMTMAALLLLTGLQAQAGMISVNVLDSMSGENGDTAMFELMFETAPIANVTFDVIAYDATEFSVPASIVFVADVNNAKLSQTFAVSGVDDFDLDGDIGG